MNILPFVLLFLGQYHAPKWNPPETTAPIVIEAAWAADNWWCPIGYQLWYHEKDGRWTEIYEPIVLAYDAKFPKEYVCWNIWVKMAELPR